jgi:hypothetical protein
MPPFSQYSLSLLRDYFYAIHTESLFPTLTSRFSQYSLSLLHDYFYAHVCIPPRSTRDLLTLRLASTTPACPSLSRADFDFAQTTPFA